jgi:hypothetical protein
LTCDVYGTLKLKISLTTALKLCETPHKPACLAQTTRCLLALTFQITVLLGLVAAAVAVATIAGSPNTAVNALIQKATQDHTDNSFHGIVLLWLPYT